MLPRSVRQAVARDNVETVFWLEALVGCMVWAGAWLLIDVISQRGQRRDLAARLARFHPSVGDRQVFAWLICSLRAGSVGGSSAAREYGTSAGA